MSDRIKKIKVKKADGSMTDYIPIGADAQNIDLDHNGSNVEDTLKKKPYYYNNVANMKADNTLKVGDMAITLGYYEVNDGGSAIYRIVQTSSDLTVALNNNLYAELNIDNNTCIEQFGAYGDGVHDDSEAFNKIINNSHYINFTSNRKYKIVTPNNIIKSNSVINGNNATIIDERDASGGILFKLDNNGIDNLIIKDLNIIDGVIENRREVIIGPSSGGQTISQYRNIELSNINIQYTNNVKTVASMMIYLPNCYYVNIHDCILIDKHQKTTYMICCWSTYKLGDGTAVKTMCEQIHICNCYFEGGSKGYCSWGTSTGPQNGGSRMLTIIENNKFKNISDIAIDCYHSDYVQIKNNLIASSTKGIFADGYQALVDGNIITKDWREQNPSSFIYTPQVGIYNEESYGCIFSNNIIRDCSVAGIVLGGGTCGCNINNNTFCYNQTAIKLDEGFTAIGYYAESNLVSFNHIDACYGPAFVITQSHADWIISNNHIRIWGLNNENPQPCFLLEGNFDAQISNNKISNSTSSATAQYSTAGNISNIIYGGENKKRFSGSFIYNYVAATMPVLFDCGAASYLYIMHNLFSKPTDKPHNISYLGYVVKYIFMDNRWTLAADTWADSEGGTGNHPESI